jgi:hypothetical protein
MIRQIYDWTRERAWLPIMLSLAGVFVYFFQLWHYAHMQYSVLDEGNYLYKGFLFATGRYVPFQDYGIWTNQMPLAFLIPGWAETVFGPGLRTGRYFAIVLAILMLVGLWLTSRRLGGNWMSLAVVWAVVLNPATTRMYSMFISQGLVACLLVWVMFFTLGADRRLWHLILGGLLAGVVVMTRINMLPVLALLILYVWWERGWKAALWVGGAELLVFGSVHAAYWPDILKIWARWLPGGLFPFLSPWLPPPNIPTWNPDAPLAFRIASFFLAFRFHFVALTGAVVAWLLWPRRLAWKAESHFRVAVFLSVLLLTLMALHFWAALGNDYCVFCFPTYTAFYSSLGLLLVSMTWSHWRQSLPLWRRVLAGTVMVGLLMGMAYSAEKILDTMFGDSFIKNLIALPIPRLSGGRILEGQAKLWAYFANRFHLSYETIYHATQTIFPLVLALVAGILILTIAAIISRRLVARTPTPGWTRGILGLLLFLTLGYVAAPSTLLGNGYQGYDCSGDQIAANEKVGEQLAQVIPPGSRVYWNGYSPASLTYLPDARIYPSQLNLTYSFRISDDPENLVRYGWWNQVLGYRWLSETDFVLITERNYKKNTWQTQILESSKYEELAPTSLTALCQNDSYIRIFRRKP